MNEFAIVELMGHRRYGARVTELELAGAKMLRCEVLAFDAARPPLFTQVVHTQAIYALTTCTEAQARSANQRTYSMQAPLELCSIVEPEVWPELPDAPSATHEHLADTFNDQGHACGLESSLVVDWVALDSDSVPDDDPRFSAPTRATLIEKLVEFHEGDREHVDHLLLNGDVFLRQRLTARVWANDEAREPSLDWLQGVRSDTLKHQASTALNDVAIERARQRAKWGSDGLRHPLARAASYFDYKLPSSVNAVGRKREAFDSGEGDWTWIIAAEIAQFAQAAFRGDTEEARRFAVRVGAVALAIVESIDAGQAGAK